MPVYEMKTLEAQLDETLLTDRLIALLVGGLRPARDGARVDRPLRRDGVRRGAPHARSWASGWRSAPSPALVIWMVMKEVLLLLGDRPGGRHARRRWRSGASSSTQLYGIEPNDPWIAVGTMTLLARVARAAGLIPARRASRIDPILALRYE